MWEFSACWTAVGNAGLTQMVSPNAHQPMVLTRSNRQLANKVKNVCFFVKYAESLCKIVDVTHFWEFHSHTSQT